jgi:hypothetical protein
MRRTLLMLLAAACCGVFAQSALAAGGSYTVVGGTPKEQATVHAALDASSFNWGLIPSQITINVGSFGSSYSTYGQVFIDGSLLDAGRFSWGVVQHEMGHQVDFFLLDDAKRQILEQALGGKDWCYSVAGLKHSDYGCERFASELAWAYWPSPDNAMRPTAAGNEGAEMPVAQFRALLAGLLGVPSVAAAPPQIKAFAPPLPPKPKTKPKKG